MATMTDLAKDAFDNHNYIVAAEIFERCLKNGDQNASELYFCYGDSLARANRIYEAFDVYAHICNLLSLTLPCEKLKHVACSLLDSVMTASRRLSINNSATVNNSNSTDTLDPLCCPICEDVLRYPVTFTCGHTYCRQCCFRRTQCRVCGLKLNTSGFEQDVSVKRLVERWWGPELRAADLNDEAIQYLETNALDDALRCCNQSLEQAPNSFKGLLLRSDVLYRLNHFQSSLADADNALKSRPTSYKPYYRRALALSGLGRTEEALIAHCLAVSLDKSSPGIPTGSHIDVIRLLQRLLTPSMRSNTHQMSSVLSTPYSVVRRKKRRLLSVRTNKIGTSDYEEDNSSCGEEDNFAQNRFGSRHFRRTFNLRPDVVIPKQNNKFRTLLDRIYQEIGKIKRVETKQTLLQVNPLLIEQSDFDCVLCCRTLWHPVVTPCGHTYCWVCLDRCLDYSSSCPLCMAPLIEQYRNHHHSNSNNNHNLHNSTTITMGNRNVTRFLELAMKRFIPMAYMKRQNQEMEKEPSIPVFICTTAFPTVSCPLFVYEPRYRLMVRRAIESGERKFGIVQPNSGRQRYVDYGTVLDIRDCVLLEDGRSILSTVGHKRFRVMGRSEKDGYDTAKVEYIHDEPINQDKLEIVQSLHDKVLEKAVEWYENLSESIKAEIFKSFGQMPQLENNWETLPDGPAWSWWIIAILPLSQVLKIGILATTNLEKRLRAIEKTLTQYIAAEQRRAIPLVSNDSLSASQSIDCCQYATTSAQLNDQQTRDQTSEYLL